MDIELSSDEELTVVQRFSRKSVRTMTAPSNSPRLRAAERPCTPSVRRAECFYRTFRA